MVRKRETCVVTEVSKRWLTNTEAMKYLGVSSEVLKGMREKAKIHYYRQGKTLWYELSDLDMYVQKGKVI